MSVTVSEESRTNGRWTKQEHERFVQGLQLYGKDWKKIEALVATRSGAQIRSHAQKFFIKVRKDKEHTEGQEVWEQCKESTPEHSAGLQNLGAEGETRCEYSYFFNKIVESASVEPSFDFWQRLIDHKQPILTGLIAPKRKSSFISVCSQLNEEETLLTKRVKST